MSELSPEFLLSAPDDFQVTRAQDGFYHIDYRHAGAGSLTLVALVWVCSWLLACLTILIQEAVRQGPLAGMAMGLVAFAFLGVASVVAFRVLELPLGRIHFVLAPDALQVTWRLFAWSRTRRFPLEEIRRFQQRWDGISGAGGRFTWTLVIEAPQAVRLLSAQRSSTCRWLGELLSHWSGKEFGLGGPTPPCPGQNLERQAPERATAAP